MQRILPTLAVLGALLASTESSAQSRATLRKAERAVTQPADTERVRESFQALSVELRATPDAATGVGWWTRGNLAAALVVGAERPETMASVALDSFNEALNLGLDTPPALDGLTRIESTLFPIAEDLDHPQRAWDTNQQLLIALEVRRRLAKAGGPAVDPIHAVRVHAKAVDAALATGRTREARKLFLDLDSEGGYLEGLALTIGRRLSAEQGPQAEFLFLTKLLEQHANRRKLLIRYIEICAEHSWFDEAHAGLTKALPHLADTYEDHLFVAQNLELLQRPEEAVARYKRALQHAPRGYEVNLRYASLLATMARDAELTPSDEDETDDEEALPPPDVVELQRRAVAALEVALESNPDNAAALTLVADLYRRLEDQTSLAAVEQKLAELYRAD